MRRSLEILGWLTALLIFALASHAVLAQTAPARITLREGRGRSAAREAVSPPAYGAVAGAWQETRRVRERPPRPPSRARRLSPTEDVSPAAIVRAARTLYVRPSSRVDKKYLEYKLQKYAELRDWGLMIVEDEAVADLILKVDQKALNYIFQITDPQTSIVVVSGKVVAINDLVAAEYLGKEIVKKIKDVRASGVPRRQSTGRERERDGEDETEERDAP